MTTARDLLSSSSIPLTRNSNLAPPHDSREGIAARLQKQKAAQEFASFLFLEVIKAMRATIPSSSLNEADGFSADAYMSLADVEVARVMARTEGIGLSKFIERALDVYDRVPEPSVSREAIAALTTPHASERQRPPLPQDRDSPTADHSRRSPSLPSNTSSSLPVDGRITSHFGLRTDPLGKGTRRHSGIDIAAPAGTPVKAMAAGTVVFSGPAGGYGNLVAIDHGNGITTRYAHNRTLLVSLGEHVTLGQEIAEVGSSGRSTGPHLHFEVLRDGHAVDPLAEVAKFPSLATTTAQNTTSHTVR
jgi:murein DD-endopeptidase MepM/ murein hydrolase activator NlpD